MPGRLPEDARGDPGRGLARATLTLGAASIVASVIGFTVLAYGFALSFLLALASVICGSLALHRSRHGRTRVIAIVGGALGAVPWLLFGLVALLFVFSPGE